MTSIEIVSKIKKEYPIVYGIFVEYFKTVLKTQTLDETKITSLKPALLKPHLIKIIESQGHKFLDVLIYCSYYLHDLNHNDLEMKAILVGFNKIEYKKPIIFDLY